MSQLNEPKQTLFSKTQIHLGTRSNIQGATIKAIQLDEKLEKNKNKPKVKQAGKILLYLFLFVSHKE